MSFGRILALFVIVPLVELALLIRIGQWMGVVPTVLVVVLTGAVGAALARREGVRTFGRLRGDIAGGRFPMGRLMDGAMILAAGALLLTPGILTDILGFAMLVPASRGWLKRKLAGRVRQMIESGRANLTIYYDEPRPPGRAL